MKKEELIRAVARIKIVISDYYESIGRGETGEIEKEALFSLEKIDEIINELNIPQKYIMLQRL